MDPRVALALLVAAAGATVSAAHPDPIVYDPEDPESYLREQHPEVTPLARRGVALDVASGPVAAPAPRAGEGPRPMQTPVWSTEIEIPDAAWVRLRFGEVRLAQATADARDSYLRIISLYDGHEQYLDMQALSEWAYTSAYFNGGRLRVEIMAGPGNPGLNSVEITAATASEPTVFPRSICGTVDDRVLSSDPRAARMMPIGCTGWLFGDQPHSFISAGHCNPRAGDVMQFNVPLSSAGGTPQNPPPSDQYPIDASSVQRQDGGVGNDWAFYGAFANANTGLAPRDAMGDSYLLADSIPPVDGRDIRITGYGSTTAPVPATWYLVQKTHAGPFVSNPGTTLRYSTDTTGGNSGSAVLDDTTNRVIGVHTHAGCNTGGNQGTSLAHSGFQAALANPQGITVPLGLELDLIGQAPLTVHPAGGDAISITVLPDNGRLPSGVVTLWVDRGTGFEPFPMTHAGADTYTGVFPPADCASNVRFYFTAQDTMGSTWSLPTAGQSAAWTALAATGLQLAMDDNFETDQGWTVQNTNLQTGAWVRAIPGNFGRNDPPADADGSGRAFVTGNTNQEDVDGGPTVLTSPVMDLTGMANPTVAYARWHYSNGADPLVVQFSNNNGAIWHTVESIPTSTGWVNAEFRVADFVTPTDSFRVRFSVADTGAGSVVESGVDAFRVYDVLCADACPADLDGDGALTFFDLAAYLDLYNAGDDAADVNGDGLFNFFDLSEYLNLYGAGCP